jgi:hypothetical protein
LIWGNGSGDIRHCADTQLVMFEVRRSRRHLPGIQQVGPPRSSHLFLQRPCGSAITAAKRKRLTPAFISQLLYRLWPLPNGHASRSRVCRTPLVLACQLGRTSCMLDEHDRWRPDLWDDLDVFGVVR